MSLHRFQAHNGEVAAQQTSTHFTAAGGSSRMHTCPQRHCHCVTTVLLVLRPFRRQTSTTVSRTRSVRWQTSSSRHSPSITLSSSPQSGFVLSPPRQSATWTKDGLSRMTCVRVDSSSTSRRAPTHSTSSCSGVRQMSTVAPPTWSLRKEDTRALTALFVFLLST
jgi:hypothetical protein